MVGIGREWGKYGIQFRFERHGKHLENTPTYSKGVMSFCMLQHGPFTMLWGTIVRGWRRARMGDWAWEREEFII